MKALIDEGIAQHPRLQGESGDMFEVLHLFVKSTDDVWQIASLARELCKKMRGKKKTSFWMLWPAEWEDTGDADFACYVERQSLFAAQRACEAVGIPSGFPHPADQFEYITSKSWMATLSTNPMARLPACTLVTKEQVIVNPTKAASDALAAIEQIKHICPPIDKQGPLSSSNTVSTCKGVVKIGWSWENRFVSVFNNESELKSRLMTMMGQKGCLSSSCIVQEFVDFDFEMRLYFLPPVQWRPGMRVEPRKIECNAWGERSDESKMGSSHASFSKVSEQDALTRWDNDVECWEKSKKEAIDVAQLLLTVLLASNAKPVPMIRLDFMLRRTGPGKPRVVFGEYCEMGACCLNWREGPPTIWRAAIDSALA